MVLIGSVLGLVFAGIIFYRLIFGWPDEDEGPDIIVVIVREDELDCK